MGSSLAASFRMVLNMITNKYKLRNTVIKLLQIFPAKEILYEESEKEEAPKDTHQNANFLEGRKVE